MCPRPATQPFLQTVAVEHLVTGESFLIFEMEKEGTQSPFDRLRANGSSAEVVTNFPFVLSLSKHERHSSSPSQLGKLMRFLAYRDFTRETEPDESWSTT